MSEHNECPHGPRIDALEARQSEHDEILGREPSIVDGQPGRGLIGAVHRLVTAWEARDAAEAGRRAIEAAAKAEADAKRAKLLDIVKVAVPVIVALAGGVAAAWSWLAPHLK